MRWCDGRRCLGRLLAGALMHAWNPDFVKTNFPRHIERWSKDGPDGTLWIDPAISPAGFGENCTTRWYLAGRRRAHRRSATADTRRLLALR